MKYFTLLTLIIFSKYVFAGGSGGTSGGRPIAVEAVQFTSEQKRKLKLSKAIDILKKSIPKNCLPKDYNNTLLSELDHLINTNQIFYFPETAMLGSNRYEGDYDSDVSKNGNPIFYKVSAFTEKEKFYPIYFTKDTNNINAKELAMTFAQDLNDHVLQWKNESNLNLVGEMAMGKSECRVNAWPVSYLYSQFPELNIEFESKKNEFLSYIESEIVKNKQFHFGREFVLNKIKKTSFGFIFEPTSYFKYFDVKNKISVKSQPGQYFEVILNPFKYVKPEYLADSEKFLTGIVLDPLTGTIITEFQYSPEWEKGIDKSRFNMDFICDSRQLNGNDGLRWRSDFESSDNTNNKQCKLAFKNSQARINIFRDKKSICNDLKDLDYFNKTKTINDYATEVYCDNDPNDSTFNHHSFENIFSTKKPVDMVKDIIQLNEKYYRMKYSLPDVSKVPWITKNVLGGKISVIPGMLSITTTNENELYSVYVAKGGYFSTFDTEENLHDDDDFSYQCFFSGKNANKCIERNYNEDN